MKTFQYVLFFFVTCVVYTANCEPVLTSYDHDVSQTRADDRALFGPIGDVTSFLRSWFSTLRRRMYHVFEKTPPSTNTSESHVIKKRHINPPINFEDLERDYMINETTKYLKQFFGYAKYVNTDTGVRAELDQMCNDEMKRIMGMSTEQLNNYMRTLKSSLNIGIGHGNTIRVKGHTYSLDNVGSWCCPF